MALAGNNHRIRVLIAKTGLDGHDRGPKLVATGLREAGMEVIYLGTLQPLARIVRTALDEAVDVVGLSCHAGEHVVATAELRAALDAAGLRDVHLLVGGVFPIHDLQQIEAAGAELVARVGESLPVLAERIRNVVAGSTPRAVAGRGGQR